MTQFRTKGDVPGCRYSLVVPFLALAALAACESSTNPICTRAEEGAPCSAGNTATASGPDWIVTLRATRTEEVEYQDGGVQCSLTRSSCAETVCRLDGGVNLMSQAEAIDYCAASSRSRLPFRDH